ncbi:MAG: hypothetical protein H6818_19005 [Phycisphaerales bacterium]|nr:hypothetical protein [Phycisphaerales bacterium]MCB9863838.1 hypothetical protein [Phycisphaerales bacterium]
MIQIEKGACRALFAYDVGYGIDLDAVERLVSDEKHRERIRRSQRVPEYFEFSPLPVSITREIGAVELGRFSTRPTIEMTLYDFGAVSVAFFIPLTCAMHDVVELSGELWDNRLLLKASRDAVESLVRDILSAIDRPGVSAIVEDYVVYQIAEIAGGLATPDVVNQCRPALARIISAEDVDHSQQQREDLLSGCVSYGSDDVSFIDWHAAILFNADADDVLAVLEYVNVEMLEMRFLDDQLDRALDEGYKLTRPRRWWRRANFRADLARIAELQLDGVSLFEGVNNAIKLLGDQYLARVYRVASEHMHLNDWDASVIRKLEALDSIYGKMSDLQSARRSETLEWIIIVLIMFEIVITLVTLKSH